MNSINGRGELDPLKPQIVRNWDSTNSLGDSDSGKENVLPEILPTAAKVNKAGKIDRKDAKKLKALDKQKRIEKAASKKISDTPSAAHNIADYEEREIRVAEQILGIRFSQDSVEAQSSDGVDLFEVIRSKGWKKNSPIKVVVMPDGDVTSLDNRRVLAAKKIVRISHSFFQDSNALEALIFPHQETTGAIKKDVLRLEQKVTRKVTHLSVEHAGLHLHPHSYGAMVYYRMRLGEGDVPSQPFGFKQDPIVRLSRTEEDPFDHK